MLMAATWAMKQLSLVEEGGGGDDADFILRLVGSDLRHETTPLWEWKFVVW